MRQLRRVPPSPEVMARLFAEYLSKGKPQGLTFKQYLAVIGLVDDSGSRRGMDDGVRLARVAPGGPERISVPQQPIRGSLSVQVLLVDFSDQPGTRAPSDFTSMLFSKGSYPTGSMRDFYSEVSLANVDVNGSVYGWLRMPHPYSYYTNGSSGTGDSYPRNAQGLAEDAVRAALAGGVPFPSELDLLQNGTVTALIVVHAGVGAEAQSSALLRNNNIWSHKWVVPNAPSVGPNLKASVYLTVPEDAKVGVCAHELGHLAFQWEDFYDPNYDEDGSEWDGAGNWDLMAGGSWNGNGARPAHPAGLHKAQHGWVEIENVAASANLVLEPYTPTSGKVVKIRSPQYRAGQYLLLENRAKRGFDSDLPGEGLLVWRVDESREMLKPDRPALLLLQADGRHDLERADDWNTGDAGDPFPGNSARRELTDAGDLSTSFAEGAASGVTLRNIQRDAATGRISFALEIGAGPTTATGALSGHAEPLLAIPDADPRGTSSSIVLNGAGSVRELAVEVAIAHSYVGDLRVELFAPSGLSAVLHDRAGGNGDDLRKVYRSSEVASLAALSGVPVNGTWRLSVSDLVRADVGTLESWGIALIADTGSDVIRVPGNGARDIPDENPAGIADTVAVAEAGVARAIAVSVDISHSYVADLRLELVNPAGDTAVLQERVGGSQRDLKKTFSSAETATLGALVGAPIRGNWSLRVADLVSRDTGTLKSWQLELRRAATPQFAQQEASPNLAIPDATPAGIGSALTFANAGTVQSLALKLHIEHPYIGDLRVELVAPSGARATLWDRAGGRTQDLSLDLSSSNSQALSALSGQPLAGAWVLRVADLADQDKGTLKFWSLGVSYA